MYSEERDVQQKMSEIVGRSRGPTSGVSSCASWILQNGSVWWSSAFFTMLDLATVSLFKSHLPDKQNTDLIHK